MKTTTSALITYLNGLRPISDAPLSVCNLFTIVIGTGALSGTSLTYTDLEVPVNWNGYTYLANSILISGLVYKCSLGPTVDSQKITLKARSSDTIGGVPFLKSIANGLLDGATILREQAFFTSTLNANPTQPLVPIGTVRMFKGRFGQIDSIGGTQATITVNSEMVVLDIDMPKNLYAPSCQNTFCDTTCGLAAGTFSATGTVGSSSTSTVINWSSSNSNYAQGTLTFTSGANSGVVATIKSANSSSMTLMYPLPVVPTTGDAFTAFQGCDHTMSTCSGTYSNINNFRGFPFVPPPEIMTGPLSSTYVSGGK
jgi:uncharacterized phage protein (TIGR02218 family)